MKFLARFVIPNKTASAINVDITKNYYVDLLTDPNFTKEFMTMRSPDIPDEFLIEPFDHQFFDDRLVIRGWFNYNHNGNEPFLFKGIVELKSVL